VIRRHVTRFGLALAGIALAALAIRIVYGLRVMGAHRFGGDAVEFHLLAQVLGDTGSYLQPFPWLLDHHEIPTAEKPPLFPAYLAVWTKLGAGSYKAHLVAGAFLGAGSVAAIGAIGRRVGGAALGLVAAAVAAVYPNLILLDASLRSESLYVLLIALGLLAAYRVAERPSWQRSAWLGVAIGLAALTRSEAVFLVLLLGLPAVWLGAARGARLRPALAVVAGCALLLVPWVARNWIQFDRPTAISTNEGGLLAGANCDRAYHGEFIGTWACFPTAAIGPRNCNRERYRRILGTNSCYPEVDRRGDGNEAAVSARLRRRALDYAGDHAGRVPAVASVRLLRTWELWDPAGQASIEAFFADRNRRYNRWAQASLWVMLVLAVAGVVLLRRRGEPLRLLLSLPVLVSLVAILSYGSTRFRAAAEVTLVVLAAVALVAAANRLRVSRR
jgi:4-amino-4-deoxy-L-arabinose transferase-like glycosyltransferase